MENRKAIQEGGANVMRMVKCYISQKIIISN